MRILAYFARLNRASDVFFGNPFTILFDNLPFWTRNDEARCLQVVCMIDRWRLPSPWRYACAPEGFPKFT
jgi:hypothetical protein